MQNKREYALRTGQVVSNLITGSYDPRSVVIPEPNSGSTLSQRMEAGSAVDIFLKDWGKREVVGILLSVLLHFKFYLLSERKRLKRSQYEEMKL